MKDRYLVHIVTDDNEGRCADQLQVWLNKNVRPGEGVTIRFSTNAEAGGLEAVNWYSALVIVDRWTQGEG